MARQAKAAVIFRRGPSKWTQLIQWNTQNDTFVYGQWFKGRIYEKRCDLSPNGDLLLYFVSKFNKKTLVDSEYTYAWTAISKPPWLTALALWPKGDCWHGGGLFEDNKTVELNHRPETAKPHPQHLPPRWITITSNPKASGEDDPIYSKRLTRDGWRVVQDGEFEYIKSNRGYVTHQPEVRIMRHSNRPLNLVMKRQIDKFEYSETYEVENLTSGKSVEVNKATCARWDDRGRLIFTSEGKLQLGDLTEDDTLVTKEISNFNDQEPKEIESPNWAKKW